MMKNVLEYLEASAEAFPDKTAVIDEQRSLTYRELVTHARQIGRSLLAMGFTPGRPAALLMRKSVTALELFFGIVYAGGFYTLIDSGFPKARIAQILSVLQPAVVILPDAVPEAGSEDGLEAVSAAQSDPAAAVLRECGYAGTVCTPAQLLEQNPSAVQDLSAQNPSAMRDLSAVRAEMTDTAPLYCNFTSGSTGVPKGVLVGHRSVIDFIDHFTEMFGITGADVIGNQAPFDFDVSVKDIYSAIKTGATLVIIPTAFFSFPNKVVEMLETHRVTTLIWAVSALVLLARMHALKYIRPGNIRRVLFSGEQMPVKQLNVWREAYPEADFVNLYGPTEITCNCTWYRLERPFEQGEAIPMGRAFPNEKVFLLKVESDMPEDDAARTASSEQEVSPDQPGVVGEVCVAGTCLALGYYGNPEATEKAFTANPLQPAYPEPIYRTGDLACYGEDGLLYFAGRKDFQIKHMGHRIELEEVERAVSGVTGVEQVCCLFDHEKGKLIAVYVGDADRKSIVSELKVKIPDYMLPNKYIQVGDLPLTKNGKTDRKALSAQHIGR